jgi:hypothetical protein
MQSFDLCDHYQNHAIVITFSCDYLNFYSSSNKVNPDLHKVQCCTCGVLIQQIYTAKGLLTFTARDDRERYGSDGAQIRS